LQKNNQLLFNYVSNLSAKGQKQVRVRSTMPLLLIFYSLLENYREIFILHFCYYERLGIHLCNLLS
jgi:hypothetical protein